MIPEIYFVLNKENENVNDKVDGPLRRDESKKKDPDVK